MEGESPNLPYEIIFNILSRLSVKLLCRFKSVSNPWLSLITNPHFVKAHLNQSTKDNDTSTQKLILTSRTSPSVYSLDHKAPAPGQTLAELEMPSQSRAEILGSYNGIVLLRLGAELCLSNPTIRMYKKFSPPDYPDGIVIYGLGYNLVVDDFVVVRAIRPLVDAPYVVHVFSSKPGSWKRIGDFGYEIYHDGPGATLNGAPHWVVSRGTDSSFLASEVIVWFDAFEEKFREVPRPTDEGHDRLIELRVLGGWLCVVQKDQQYESLAHVWVMTEYRVKESWTKQLSVPYGLGEFCMPLCYEKVGDVVMVVNSEMLRIFNMKKLMFNEIVIPHRCKFDATLFVESLVSPHGGRGTS
ncbi:F-box protein CPR1-like [Rhododendron vialii]|uniref:F-box protein CPR1-like n=1 Tax=Rhododendron vialii TaxID=182163 RepID=UPI00265DBB4A|nr:F-box protein CPR1-like [Rhododendron vialii]